MDSSPSPEPGDGTESTGAGGGEAFDERRAFDLLAAPRRRYVVQVLSSADEPMTVDELVRRVASVETGEDAATLDDDLESLRIRLFHVHLPELSAAGVVEYDSHERTIAATDRLDPLLAYRQQLFD